MYGLELTLFRTRVARRVFALFLAAVLLPVAATAVLAIHQIGAALTGAAEQRLADSARSYGQSVYRRLLFADAALSRIPLALDRFDASRDRALQFDAVASVAGQRVTRLYGDLDEKAALEIGSAVGQRSALKVVATSSGRGVLLAHPVAGGGALVGEVSPAYLWDQYTPAVEQEICVLGDGDAAPLFCTAPLPAEVRDQWATAESRADSSTIWEAGGRRFRVSRWELFTQSGFDGSSWHVVAFIDDSAALASLIAFKRIFPVLLVATLIVAVLMSIWRIRRSLVPLEELVEGTRRIAHGDFEKPVCLDRNDEFGELARALNSMSVKLGRQFAALNMMARIDRSILDADDLEQVLRTGLAEIREVLSCDVAGVALLDRESPTIGQLFCLEAAVSGSHVTARRIAVTDRDRELLCRHGELQVLSSLHSPLFANFSDRDLTNALVIPIASGRSLAGALILGFSNAQNAGSDDWQPARDLADRLAVAVSACEREAELFNRAHYDPLTGLPNRQLFRDRLMQALAQARRNEHELAVLFLDLDGFKTINDSLGHSAGDALLREVSSRLLTCVRDTDTVGRLGGDEFVVILPQVAGTTEIEAVAKKLMASFGRPIEIVGKHVFVTASIGVTKFPEDGDTVESLLQRADAAMYDAKAAGRSRYVFFTNEIAERVTERLSLETDLRVALQNGELELRYQPQVLLEKDEVVGAEALLRWVHPRRGVISPSVFVPILEQIGLIDTVGNWVLSSALKQLRAWRADGLPLQRVAVNVSAHQLRHQSFAEQITALLEANDVPPTRLELELTESVFLEDMERSNAALRELRLLGVTIAIDDFGTGYSSFSYLRDLQFDAVKIDRTFVRDLPDHRAVAISRAIVAVAQTLGKTVIAEGVETEAQLAPLHALGVDVAQGYLLSRPLEAADLGYWVRSRRAGIDLSDSFIARVMG